MLALSEEGDVFAWGNSEYNQLSIVTDQTQINIPKYLPLKHCGKIIKAASAGSKCAIVNSKYTIMDKLKIEKGISQNSKKFPHSFFSNPLLTTFYQMSR